MEWYGYSLVYVFGRKVLVAHSRPGHLGREGLVQSSLTSGQVEALAGAATSPGPAAAAGGPGPELSHPSLPCGWSGRASTQRVVPTPPPTWGQAGRRRSGSCEQPWEKEFSCGCSGTLTSRGHVVGQVPCCSYWCQNHISLEEYLGALRLSSLASSPSEVKTRDGTAPRRRQDGVHPKGSCVCGRHTPGHDEDHHPRTEGRDGRPQHVQTGPCVRRVRACVRARAQPGCSAGPASPARRAPPGPRQLNACLQTMASAAADTRKEIILWGVASVPLEGIPGPHPSMPETPLHPPACDNPVSLGFSERPGGELAQGNQETYVWLETF